MNMNAFRPYSNVVIIEDQTPRNMTRQQERLLAEQDAADRATMTTVVSRRNRRSQPAEVKEAQPENIQEDNMDAPFAREVFGYTIGPMGLDLEAFEAMYAYDDEDYADYYDQPYEAADAREEWYEYHFRYEGKAYNPYATGKVRA
jgi:hypothetical protein